jgi:AcrR family transcriptional regulator
MTELSPLESIWTARPAAAPREGLTLVRIVATAIEIADGEGLAAVSMARIAKRIGFTPMALYRHVAGKDELVLRMQDQVLGPPPAELAPTGEWRADLRRWAWACVERARAHPWYAQSLSMFGSPATPTHLAWIELALQGLAPTTLTEGEKVETILLVNAHLLGDITFHAIESATEAAGAYDDTVSRFLDPEKFPAFARAAAAGAFTTTADPGADRDELFSFGLERILDGVAAYLA